MVSSERKLSLSMHKSLPVHEDDTVVRSSSNLDRGRRVIDIFKYVMTMIVLRKDYTNVSCFNGP